MRSSLVKVLLSIGLLAATVAVIMHVKAAQHRLPTPYRTINIGHTVAQVAYSYDGNLICGTRDFGLRRTKEIWKGRAVYSSFNTGDILFFGADDKIKRVIKVPGSPLGFDFSHSASTGIIAPEIGNSAQIVTLSNGQVRAISYSSQYDQYDACMSPDGRYISGLDACDSKVVRIFTTAGLLIKTLHCRKQQLDVTFSSSSKLLAVSDTDIDGDYEGPDGSAYIDIYNTASGRRITSCPVHSVGSLLFSPDSTTVYFSDPYMHGVRAWSVSGGKQLWSRDLNFGGANIAVSPNGKVLSADVFGSIDFLSAATGEVILSTYPRPLGQLATSYRTCAFSPDGKTLASRGSSCINLWRVPSI